ncbi:auxin-responsive protein SAUR71-like [Juglans microcarpa x Juglans regia]|uniref:auxin-responsive protein SAUR71-like n=1 Tax=Juglans microcarpa x Juglans regia TaxID=2249226 RepID=UPI001B7F1748|nr:auxin-responsive protein SAUR71-like [Juglans microcarpa x Juglans regia]
MWMKSMIYKTWERCRSRQRCCNTTSLDSEEYNIDCMKSKCRKKRSREVAPEAGCFSVYVGPQKQRFVVKIKFANHPLFAMLLEEAESEYGYNSEGPILLPCAVDLFYEVLAEMEGSSSCNDDNNNIISSSTCSTFGLIAKGYGSLFRRRKSRSSWCLCASRSPSQIN